KARGTAARLMQEAEGYRQRVVAAAEGEASRFRQVVAEYRKAPRVTRERMYLETIQNVLTNASKVVVDQRTGSNLLFLPLDKLMQSGIAPAESSAHAPAAPEVSSAPPAQPAAPDLSSRSRDAFRSREREPR